MSRLHGVKVGDKIMAAKPYLRGAFEIYVVERITKTLAVCKTASFRLDSGLKVGTGDSWNRIYGSIADEAEIAERQSELELKRRIIAARTAIRETPITADNLVAAEAFIAASNKESEAAK